MWKKYRLFLSLIILATSAVLMLCSLVPGGTSMDRVVLDGSTMNTGQGENGGIPALLEEREVRLEWPRTMRIGGKGMISLEFNPITDTNTETGKHSGLTLAYDSYNVMAEARYEVSGVRVEPANPTRESMPPGQALSFKWEITADREGEYSGRVWLSLRFLPLDGSPAVQVPVYIRDVGMEAASILGMSEEAARWVSGVGLVAGEVILVGDMMRRKKDKESSG